MFMSRLLPSHSSVFIQAVSMSTVSVASRNDADPVTKTNISLPHSQILELINFCAHRSALGLKSVRKSTIKLSP
jgi:hypothetical protein